MLGLPFERLRGRGCGRFSQTHGCPNHRRFHRSTVPKQSKAYLRVMDPVTGVSPTSAQIITDTKKCFGKNLRDIWEVKGIIVPGAGNHRGHHADEAVDREVERRGGEFRPLGPLPCSEGLA